MDDVRGRFLGLQHGTTPAAVTTNKNIKMSSFKSSENIQKKEGGPDRSAKVAILLLSYVACFWCQSVTFHRTCVHSLVWFRLLSGHLLENSCSLG